MQSVAGVGSRFVPDSSLLFIFACLAFTALTFMLLLLADDSERLDVAVEITIYWRAVMKQQQHYLPLTGLLSVAIMCAFLAGCASPVDKFKDNLAVQGLKPLTGAGITEAFAGNTILGENQKHMFSRYHAVDGTAKGRAWGSWGEESAIGVWRINNEDLLCSKFEGEWAKSGERCSLVYHVTGNDYTHIIVTGTKSKSNPNGIYEYQIVPGDQSGVK